MATGKRFYWIKLKDSFMSSDEIDYLMSQPDGANYVVLYQMLCLKTINTGGCLVSQIGEMLIPYDAEKIQRECKWFSLATVRVALSVYKQIGLIFESPDGILTISNYSDIVGSETDYSAQKRLQPVATSAINTNRTKIVGTGLTLKATVDRNVLGLSPEKAKEWQSKTEAEFRLWAENRRSCDAMGLNDFYGLQQLALKSWLMSGDVFAVVKIRDPDKLHGMDCHRYPEERYPVR